ncbi:MAG: FAD-dependent oxidoreductase [Lentisphaeria bacterium]|nr:FAD-dependent oxidoreductase [Lentisphaeria bacterium]
MKIIIIGGGCAAAEAAFAARSADKEAEIAIYSNESILPYRRPSLSKMIFIPAEESQLFIKSAEQFNAGGISINYHAELADVDFVRQNVIFSSGAEISYDKLILAIGAAPIVPETFAKCSDEHIMSFRNYNDLEKIRAFAAAGHKRFSVIGGGLLGLELADGLLSGNGIEVNIFEGAPYLLPRQLDQAGGEFLAEQLAKRGLQIHCGKVITSAWQNTDGMNICCGSDHYSRCGVIIFSIGIRSNLPEAVAAKISNKFGIVTDEKMAVVGVENVYAAGDCAAVCGSRPIGMYLPAKQQGITAGTNAAGGKVNFKMESAPARLSCCGVKLFSVGVIPADLTDIELKTSIDGENMRREFYHNGKLVAAYLIGDVKAAIQLQKLIDTL